MRFKLDRISVVQECDPSLRSG